MKTIDIRGKQYVPVNERVKYFVKNYKGYALITSIERYTDEDVIIKASIYDTDNRLIGTAHAQEFRGSSTLNKTSALENAETSAIGRALGLCLSIGIDEAISSADELQSAAEYSELLARKINKNELAALKMRCESKGRDFNSLLTYYDREDGEALTYEQFMHAMRILEGGK